MINIPKGTKDVLPFDSYRWQYIEGLARSICKKYGIKEIRTPIFEHTELFLRSIGETTDVVSKEMYTFLDKGGRSLTLKPEGTAPVARAFIESALDNVVLPIKMYYFTPVLRYERPQAGRLRQHHQFGIEVYGDPTPHMDAEVISVAAELLKSAGLKNTQLFINSIGCEDCRSGYIAALKSFLAGQEESLCPTCKDRLLRNPLRVLDCKEDGCRKTLANAPKIIDFLCDGCGNHFDDLKRVLTLFGVEFSVNPWIVRGLDYYTRTVFEFTSSDLGAQTAVCGGGRYDGLTKSLGGKATPCVGFGMGLERLLMLMDAAKVQVEPQGLDYFVIVQSPECLDFCALLTRKMREKGIYTDTDYTGRSLKSQFKLAEKLLAKSVIVIGQNEMTSGQAQVKRLCDGTTTDISLADFD